MESERWAGRVSLGKGKRESEKERGSRKWRKED